MTRTDFFAIAIAVLAASSLEGAEAFHRPRWADADHDQLDTRAEVLTSRCSAWSLTGSRGHLHVAQARCHDAYSGREVTTDAAPQALQVDHLLPAAHAWQARSWRPGEYARYYNDQDNLILTRARNNARKGDRLPDSWCPANPDVRRELARRYALVADRYSIPLSIEEERGLRYWRRGQCAPESLLVGE